MFIVYFAIWLNRQSKSSRNIITRLCFLLSSSFAPQLIRLFLSACCNRPLSSNFRPQNILLPGFTPDLPVTIALGAAPKMKMFILSHTAISTFALPANVYLGHFGHNIPFIDSFWIWVWPKIHRNSNVSSLNFLIIIGCSSFLKIYGILLFSVYKVLSPLVFTFLTKYLHIWKTVF